MSSMPLAYELFRPTISRHAPAAAALLVLGVLSLSVSIDGPHAPPAADLATPEPALVETVKAGEMDVPAYYFPDSATGTDRYVTTRSGDCGAAAAAPPDYPKGWLKP